MTREEAIARVCKLVALVTDNGNEGRNAAWKACALMREHGIVPGSRDEEIAALERKLADVVREADRRTQEANRAIIKANDAIAQANRVVRQRQAEAVLGRWAGNVLSHRALS